MYTEAEILMLKNYIQQITEKPRRPQEQPCTREGVFMWCQDWEIVEILKCLVHSEPVYMDDPPPNRLKFNPLWSKEKICEQARAIAAGRTPEEIIWYLKDLREGKVLSA